MMMAAAAATTAVMPAAALPARRRKGRKLFLQLLTPAMRANGYFAAAHQNLSDLVTLLALVFENRHIPKKTFPTPKTNLEILSQLRLRMNYLL